MNPRETAALLRLLAALDGRLRRAMTDPQQAARTIDEWNEATVHIPAATTDGTWDVMHAVRRFYEQQRGDHTARYFAYEPHHLLAAWADHRGSRMERHTDPVPAADPDNEAVYRAELAATRTAVATGQSAPAPLRQAIDPAGQRQIEAMTDRLAASSYLPEKAAQALAAFRPRRAEREAALRKGEPDPLDQVCTWCGAGKGEPCRGGFRPRGKGRAVRVKPHPCRIDAAHTALKEAS
ncbi:zinc finger domain-containing protein [Streptomyces sp. DB-54]